MSKVFKGYFRSDPPVFLEGWLNFFAVAAVLFTTVFGWFFPNTWCIVLLILCRISYGRPLTNIRTAFGNRLFLAYFIFFVIETAGFLHTHNMGSQGAAITKEATMLAMAFVFCAGEFGDAKTYTKLFTAYTLTLLTASLYCLFLAFRSYRTSKDVYDFFYHTLTVPLSQNAVFFSVYMLVGIVFLLSPYGEPVIVGLSSRWRKVLRYAILMFFLGMMVLLSSRLMIVLTPLILINIVYRKFPYRKRRIVLLAGGGLVIAAIGVLGSFGSSKNFLRWRFGEIKEGNLDVLHQRQFDPATHFSSWDSRLLQWRFAIEILNGSHAWLFGVSPGDSQNLLDEKYIGANMDIGNLAEGPNRHNRGFLGFNFHNQFVETLVRSGLVGLISLVAIFVVLFAEARARGVREAWFVVLVTLIFCMPEAPITMQQGVFLLCFFPLLVMTLPKRHVDNSLLNNTFATQL